MAQIGRIKKHSQANPPYASKKREYYDENWVTKTPQPKSRRCGSTTATTPILDNTTNIIDVNQMKNLLSDMSEELGPDVNSSFILSNIAQILKLAFDDVEEAISILANEHLGLVYAPATPLAVT